MVVVFNNSTGKDSAFALSKDISLEVYINRYLENMFTLKTHHRYLKNGVSKIVVHAIKHVNFQLYMVHLEGVIWKT